MTFDIAGLGGQAEFRTQRPSWGVTRNLTETKRHALLAPLARWATRRRSLEVQCGHLVPARTTLRSKNSASPPCFGNPMPAGRDLPQRPGRRPARLLQKKLSGLPTPGCFSLWTGEREA